MQIADGRLTEIPIVSVDPTGSAHRLGTLEVRQDIATLTDQGRRIALIQPFSDRSLHAISRDGADVLIVNRRVTTDRFSVTKVRASGDTVFSVAVPYAPVPLSEAMRDSVIDERVSALGPADMMYWESLFRRELRFPEFLPPVDELFIALDGAAWMRLVGTHSSEHHWLVLNSRGGVHARVSVPGSFSPMEAHLGQGWIIGVERGLFDVPYVARYELVPQ
jgi:hypothetical protein